MAAVSTCVNHPTKTATHRCKRCSKPICAACVHKTELGIFCGPECHQAVKDFQAKVVEMRPAASGGGFFAKAFKSLVSLALLLGAIYAGFYFGLGDKTPVEIQRRVMHWIGK